MLYFQLNGSIRPVPPPRDHLRMEKDGRMVNRAPAPQVPDRNPALQSHQIAQIVDATPEQLDSIKKYQVNYHPLYFVFLGLGHNNRHFACQNWFCSKVEIENKRERTIQFHWIKFEYNNFVSFLMTYVN